MVNQENIEKLFDCFDASATLLYKQYKISYIDGLVITCENIIANSIEEKYSEVKTELQEQLKSIKDIEFDKEEIRKAFQYACLRGLKHGQISNQLITPDTIGIFINYLISKLYKKNQLTILDPLIGTGNLIATIANNSTDIKSIIGVDSDEMFYKLSSALFDMLGYGDQIYFQDTQTFKYPETDCIVGDFSGIEENQIYNIIKHHGTNILPGGFLIGVFNDYDVEPNTLIKYSQELNQIWRLFGMIKLPSNLFKTDSKSIVIFQRDGENVTTISTFLLADLADFNDKETTKIVINQLNDWFKNTEFYKL